MFCGIGVCVSTDGYTFACVQVDIKKDAKPHLFVFLERGVLGSSGGVFVPYEFENYSGQTKRERERERERERG